MNYCGLLEKQKNATGPSRVGAPLLANIGELRHELLARNRLSDNVGGVKQFFEHETRGAKDLRDD
jgi:hypothetical protein